MRQLSVQRLGMTALFVLTAVAVCLAADAVPFPVAGHSDKCPVCGMLVHRYPDFLASITYDDGEVFFFDGAKDMFKFLFNLEKYSPGRHMVPIETIRVTEYYDMAPIDARRAFYVVGSDVLGPMGHELIPFQSADDARLFLKDHNGRRILEFKEVSPATVNRLD